MQGNGCFDHHPANKKQEEESEEDITSCNVRKKDIDVFFFEKEI